jgi:hypothetical protein
VDYISIEEFRRALSDGCGSASSKQLRSATAGYLYGLDLVSATDNNGVRTYLLQDGLSSTTGLTDGSGSVADTHRGTSVAERKSDKIVLKDYFRKFLLLWSALALVSLPVLFVYFVLIGEGNPWLLIAAWAVFHGWGFLVGSAYFLCRIWMEHRRSE